MAEFDVFNGDADGICALQQLRLDEPARSRLITGVKREIELLKRVSAGAGDRVTVLDISLDKNREALRRLLEEGAEVRYFDHHFAGEVPSHPRLTAIIDPSPNVCTSLLVDAHLDGRFRAWAVTGAFGDNLDDSARQAAIPLGLDEQRLDQLRQLGIYLNYNGYGATVEDLHFPPDELYLALHPYADPFAFIEESDIFRRLKAGYETDMEKAGKLQPELETEHYALYRLPAEPWARRVSGVLGNRLAREAPERAHALLTRLPEGGYLVSVRAPLVSREGADELCRRFPTGGGRKAAAGINRLPEEDLDRFITAFEEVFGQR